MSSYTPEPSLSGVLIVLNIILALIWVPVLDAVDDTTYLFQAIFFANAFTAGWWIWMNTSLRRRIRQLSRHALACLQFLQTLATTIFAACVRLLSALDFAAYLRRPVKKRVNSVALNARQAHALRLAWLISSCYEQSRSEDVHPDSLSEDARKRRAILHLYAVIASRRTAATSNDSPQVATAITPDPSDGVEFFEDEETPARPMTADNNVDDIAALDSSCSESWTDLDPELAHDDVLHTPQASGSPLSNDHPTCDTSLHLPTITPEALSSSASLSGAQRAEYAQLHRDLCTVTKERDLYRARAYELALRLDDCYTAHSQTSCALEGAERELMEVQSAITELEEERRALSVALGVVTAALRRGTASELPTSSSPVGRDLAQNVLSTSEEEVVYPRASATEDIADATSRPLLLPPSEDSEVESPAPRMRTATWTTSSAVPRPKSKLEAIIHEAQQRARDARSKTAGSQGAIWDAQRVASARPIFSVIHEDIKAEHAYGQGVAASPRLAGLTEAEQIIEDLRASRVAVHPPESPALTSESTVEEPQACAPKALELEAVPEVEEVEIGVEETEAPMPETPQPQVVLDGPNDERPVGMVDTQSMEDVHQEKARETIVTINVPISRHPRGPPPSPFGKAVERELEAAAIYTKGKEQTWRGRSKPASALDASTLLASLKADPYQPYPESRLPNRVRERQATAPSPTTSHPLVMPPTVPIRVNISPSHSMVLGANEHKRHATFCGDSPAPAPSIVPKSTSVGSPRWPSSVLGNGGIERLRASLQPYPFVPNSAFYQTAGKV